MVECIPLREALRKLREEIGCCMVCEAENERIAKMLGLRDDDPVTIVEVDCCGMPMGGYTRLIVPCPPRRA